MTPRLLGPILRSAWPTPSLDNLLRAALLSDEAAAAAAWRVFEAAADFDRLTAGEMRLIGLAARRMPVLAPNSPMRARIGGIERANWSRSQLAIGDAGTGLRALAAASIEMLAIKGAGRVATGGPTARARMVNDVDVVVRPDDMARAFDVLIADGWLPAGSGSAIYHRTRLADAVGINLVRGRFGNLDLHRTAFHPPYLSLAEDDAIWPRSVAATLAQAAVRVPGAADAIAIAMAHGALDAHKSSDWLADITAAIDSGVDWEVFESVVERRRLEAAAAIALRYTRERLVRPIPESLLTRLEAVALRRPGALVTAVAETRPKSDRIGLFWLARALAKQSRLLRTYRGRKASRGRVVLASPFEPAGRAMTEVKVLEQPLALPGRGPGEAWRGTVDLTIAVALPAVARRLEFEVNAGNRHLLRLRALAFNRGPRERRFRFRFPLVLVTGDADPVLIATACRRFNTDAEQALTDRYGATPFALVAMGGKRAAGN